MTGDANAQPTGADPQPSPDAQLGEQISAQPAKRSRWRLSRRGFLIGAGVVAGGLALGYVYGVPWTRLQLAGVFEGAEGQPSRFPEDPWAWFEVLPDNRIRLYLMKVEMGQGVHTSLAQIAVEELGIAWEDLDIAQASTGRDMGDSLMTSGSSSVSGVFQPLLEAAATFRAMLAGEAAALLGVPADQVVVAGRGFAVQDDPAQRVDFATVATSKTEWEAPKEPVPIKNWQSFSVIGQPRARVDIPAKVTGQAIYGMDARLDGMKYGAVVRPPTISATAKSLGAGGAAEMEGVVKVVVAEDFAGVVADTRTAAYAAVTQMSAEWDMGHSWQQAELEAIVTVDGRDGIVIQEVGDASRLLGEETTLTSEYRTPFAIHTPLEAQAALADVQPDYVRVWCSTQGQGFVRTEVAKAIGVDEQIVEVIPTYLGGGYGRKAGWEVAIEAARLAQAAGVPVHVGWSRLEELRYGYFRPLTHHQLAGRVDAAGNLLAIEHRQASGDVAFDFLPPLMTAVMGADFGAYRGATIRYDAPNKRTVAFRRDLPIRTGWWRGLGLLPNTFAVESFIDELAHAAAIDPLAFRLQNLHDEGDSGRLKRVLQAAADLGEWGQPAPAGRARGIAATIDVGTAVAMVAEVSVDVATGKIRVHKVSAAMDCGLTVNPDGARAQVEGNVMWGVGSALIEEMTVQDGQVVPANFDRYPLLTMKEAPDVAVVLLEAGDGVPRGVGEPPIGPVAPAIANAFYALTGRRVHQLPMNEARVLAALA
ncbi:molybdopterin cofactor-binding domain-containing protein [Caldilinea sp.]|uniref:xanthine dehydrogenase family protein molybdopterin-binding subunit n=1 Tax=Caldilinea sp. TaxID=2293560 RepID=UPI002C3875C9|nr:molybdopterin-dependent oxidoreductase [Caldilinea sp.]